MYWIIIPLIVTVIWCLIYIKGFKNHKLFGPDKYLIVEGCVLIFLSVLVLTACVWLFYTFGPSY